MKLLFGCAVLAACGGGGNNVPVDASVAIDARAPDAPASVGNAKSHTLFVNTEGAMVSAGADDATTNHSSIPAGAGPFTLQAWRVGDAARATKIAAVMAQLTTTLAPYGVSVVSTRPAAGPYDMLVVTDDASSVLGFPAGVGSISPTTCNDTPSVIAFVFPATLGTSATDAQTRNDIANLGIAMFGVENGVPASAVANDCMCLSASVCNAKTQPCTIGGSGTAVDTSNGGIGACGDTSTTMDEGAKFLAAFGSHS